MNNGCKGQTPSSGKVSYDKVRPMAVADHFYPSDKTTLSNWFSKWKTEYSKGNGNKRVEAMSPSNVLQAIIVPHAGYVFSGPTAMAAFSCIDTTRKYDHIFLLGPSHHVWLNGASVNNAFDAYQTPFGPVPVDRSLGDTLIAKSKYFSYRTDAHSSEHCLEVQLPMLKWLYKDNMPPIVPIIISSDSLNILHSIAQTLQPWFNERNLFIISSDFSHYPSYKDANMVDSLTAKAIMTGSVEKFIDQLQANADKNIHNLSTSACGEMSIVVLLSMMEAATGNTFDIEHLQYCNSGDSQYGDYDQVVGYNALAVTINNDMKNMSFTLTEDNKKTLLKLARATISNALGIKTDIPKMESWATVRCGAFVTLTIDDNLRGCIGHFGEDTKLWDAVKEMALSAAFNDPRFYPLSKDELSSVNIEISVLTPLKRIKSIDEFQLHRDGIFIKKDGYSGTYLPQVADEVPWSKEEFISHCAHDKAGIGWDGWKDAELYTYQAIIFHE